MKEKLIGALGGIGFIVWYLIAFLYTTAPVYFLPVPFWLKSLFVFIVMVAPVIGGLLGCVLYVWAFVIVIHQPIDIFSIVFFVFAALYLFTSVIPAIGALFSKK